MPSSTGRSVPLLTDLTAALGALTMLPFSAPAPQSPAFGRASLFFPVCGLLIGGVLVATARLLTIHVHPALGAVVLTLVWETLGGFGALSAALEAARSDDSAKRSSLPRWTAPLVILALVGAKALGLYAAAAAVPAAVLFAPILGRWAVVVLATGARDVLNPNRKFNTGITFQEFAVTSIFTFGALFTLAGATAILVVVCAAGLTLLLRLLLHRWPGGVSWGWLLGCCELVEAGVVLVCAMLAH